MPATTVYKNIGQNNGVNDPSRPKTLDAALVTIGPLLTFRQFRNVKVDSRKRTFKIVNS
jgi:hypothetical protein